MDSALAEATRKSGKWLACRLGCTQCCVGVFAINQLDALRLRSGLDELEAREPRRAAAVRERARAAVNRLAAEFPGDAASGLLCEGKDEDTDKDADKDAGGRFADFANDEICPALDPASGACELYDARPITCRVFGPPVRSEDGLGVCELCFHGATEKEIAACEMLPDPDDRESALLKELEEKTGARGDTIVAFALAR